MSAGGAPGGTQGLILAQCLGTPGGTQGINKVLEIEPWSAICQASMLSALLSLQLSFSLFLSTMYFI